MRILRLCRVEDIPTAMATFAESRASLYASEVSHVVHAAHERSGVVAEGGGDTVAAFDELFWEHLDDLGHARQRCDEGLRRIGRIRGASDRNRSRRGLARDSS